MKTNELKIALKNIFSTVIKNVYYVQASAKKEFPYLVWEINIMSQENSTLCNVEVNVWDNFENSERIDTICDRLIGLDSYNYMDSHIQFCMYFENARSVIDECKELRRRRIIFTLRVYDVKEE